MNHSHYPERPSSSGSQRMTNAMKLDSFLGTELGLKIALESKDTTKVERVIKSAYTHSKTPSNSLLKPTLSLIPQPHNPPTQSISSSFAGQKKNVKFEIDSEHQKITQISNKMKDLELKLNTEMGKLDRPLTPQQRKSIFNSIKEAKNQYKSLKDARLITIKRQRLIKNEYKKGFSGFEIYLWQDEKKALEKTLKSTIRQEIRRNTLAEKSSTSNALLFNEGRENITRPSGVRILQDTIPTSLNESRSLNSSQVFTPNAERTKRLSIISHGKRNYNIITGVSL